MASLADKIPLELMRPEKKLAVIDFIRSLGLPARIKRKMLQDWGDAVFADLNGTDYELATSEVRL